MTADPEPRKVISLRGVATPGLPEVDPDIVHELEHMLELARDGQIVGLIAGHIHATGDVYTCWAGSADQHKFISAASILQHQIIAENQSYDDE